MSRSWRWSALLWLLGAGWFLATPVLLYGALVTSASFFGDAPSPAQLRQAEWLAMGALATGVGAPLLGLAVALSLRRRAAAWVFAGALAVTVLAWGALALN